jgi:uncharacterized protein YfaS (alpha-2-macroglobulin family)
LRYHVPESARPKVEEAFAVDVRYDRTELKVGEALKAEATVRGTGNTPSPMVMLELPVPAGFTADAEQFRGLVEAKTVARYQVQPGKVLLYLRELEPGRPLTVAYRLTATLPVKVTVPPARAYEYYDPDRQGTSRPETVTVRERG